MKKNKSDHKYLLTLFSRVNDFLSNGNIREDLPDIIVSFCVVVEKIMKIKLYRKNPLLVFDISCLKSDENVLPVILLKKEVDIETAKIEKIISRFEIIFKRVFTTDELQAIRDIYKIRNNFIHGYKSDEKIIFNTEDIVKKMGTIWEKISTIITSLFGKENIKSREPKKKYTEKELEKVLENEVRKMIQPLQNNASVFRSLSSVGNIAPSTYLNVFSKNKCPRCGYYSLALNDYNSASAIDAMGQVLSLNDRTNLYKCDNCHLELTEKQYEIAKEITGCN